MSPALRPPSRLLPSLLALTVPLGLACSGLPVPGAISGAGEGEEVGDGEPAGGDEGEVGGDEGEGEEAPAAGGDPESLFGAIEAAGDPPFARGVVKCPPGLMTIRYPKGKTLSVYCATGSGVRSGPYTEWQSNTLVVSATNVDGKLEGPWTRWEKGGFDTLVRVEHQVYAAGQATGDHAQWDTSGRLLSRGVLVDGKKHGKFIERTVAPEGEIVAGGACWSAGSEVWRTTDDAELTSKVCGSDVVAEG